MFYCISMDEKIHLYLFLSPQEKDYLLYISSKRKSSLSGNKNAFGTKESNNPELGLKPLISGIN